MIANWASWITNIRMFSNNTYGAIYYNYIHLPQFTYTFRTLRKQEKITYTNTQFVVKTRFTVFSYILTHNVKQKYILVYFKLVKKLILYNEEKYSMFHITRTHKLTLNCF